MRSRVRQDEWTWPSRYPVLDEIAELDLNAQARLLQLLQGGQYCRLGAQREKHIQARIICAANNPLEHAVKCGAFREDLLLLESAFFPGAAESAATQRDIPMLVA